MPFKIYFQYSHDIKLLPNYVNKLASEKYENSSSTPRVVTKSNSFKEAGR